MKTSFKRVLSVVLALLMLLPMFSALAFAKENVDVTNIPKNIASAADITVVEGLTWAGWKPENLVDEDATTGTYSPRGKAYSIELSFVKAYYFTEVNVLVNREGTLPNVEAPEQFSDTTSKIKVVAYNGSEVVYESDAVDTSELDTFTAPVRAEADRIVISAPELSDSALGCESLWEIEAYSRTTPGVCDAETKNVAGDAILTAKRRLWDKDKKEYIETNEVNGQPLEWWATNFKALTDGDIHTGTKSPKAPDFILQFDYGAERMISSVVFTTNGYGTVPNSGEIGVVKDEEGNPVLDEQGNVQYKAEFKSYTMTIHAFNFNDEEIYKSDAIDVSSIEQATFNIGVKASRIWCSISNAGGDGYNGNIHMWEVEINEESGSHALEKSATNNPSCVAPGYIEYTCQDYECGYTKKEALNPTGFHTWGEDYVLVEEPTTTENGKGIFQCTVCSEKVEREVPALEHNWDNGTIVKPNCTDEGYTIYKCTDAGCTLSYKANFVSALGHNLDDGIVEKKATSTEKGKLVYSCLRAGCDFTEDKELRLARYSDSTFVVDSSIVDRYESSQVASTDAATDAFSVLGKHLFDGVTNEGMNGFGTDSMNYFFIPGNSHMVDMLDENGQPMLNDKGEVRKEESFRDTGCLYIYLNREYYFTKGTVYAAANYRHYRIHFQYQNDSGEWVDSAVFFNDRLDNKTVSAYNFTGQLNSGARTGRIVVKSVNGAPVTYAPTPKDSPTNTGGNLQIHEIVLEAHKCEITEKEYEDEANWNKATCTTDGSCEATCVVCGTTQTVVLPKEEYGHDLGAETVVVEPTCAADGIAKASCKNCSYEKTNIIVPKTGAHDYSKVITYVDPTCDSKGIERLVCSHCGAVETETPLPATGVHVYDWITKSSANYTAQGTTIHACIYCNEKSGLYEDVIEEKLPVPDNLVSLVGYEIRMTNFVGLRAKFTYDTEALAVLQQTCDITITINVKDSNGNEKSVEVLGKRGTQKYDKATGEFAVVLKAPCTEEFTFSYSIKLVNFRGTIEKDYTFDNMTPTSAKSVAQGILDSGIAIPADVKKLYQEIVAEASK